MSDGLNEAQVRAVQWSGGPLVVLAGPGTGKTRVIIHRVRDLIERRGAEPESVVAVTYTVKAAEEMRERLGSLLGGGLADRVNVHTFHGLGSRLLRRFGDMLGLPPSPDIIDSAQTRRLVRDIVQRERLFRWALGVGIETATEESLRQIERMQDFAVTLDRAMRVAAEDLAATGEGDEARARRAAGEKLRDTARLGHLLGEERLRRGWISFGDLISLPARLLRENGAAAAIVRSEWKHFIVDEYQDSNPAQMEFLRGLAPGVKADVCIVGDDDQAIYAFRGGDDRAFQKFVDAWPGATTIELTTNYRSVPGVVAAANAVVRGLGDRFAPGKRVESGKGEEPGSGVWHVETDDDYQFGSLIAAQILTEQGLLPLSKYAVLARSHLDLERVAEALELEGIAVARQRAEGAHEDPGVMDAMSWMRLLTDESRVADVRRVLVRPPCSTPPETVARLTNLYAAEAARAEEDRRTMPGFALWLAGRAAGEPGVSRFLELSAALKGEVATRSAASAVSEIVARANLAHADLPAGDEGRVRARRIAALAALIGFVHDRQRRLEPPGDVGAFLRYYDDLDKSEQQFVPLGGERVEGSPRTLGAEEGVRLLTAHSAKGLEFDTVFVIRVSSPHGFPKAAGEGVDLPASLQEEEQRSEKERRADEERRLFYVACTRAERRLVLMSKPVAIKSKALNFVRELCGAESGVRLSHQTAASVLERARAAGIELRSAEGRGVGATLDRSAADAARLAIRSAAAAALDAVDRPGVLEADVDKAAQELERAVRLMGVVSHAARHREVPAWAKGEAAELGRRVLEEESAARASAFRFERVEAPLSLSYTEIRDYLSCPRCWYVKNVMGIREEASTEVNTGQVVHRVLERWFKLVRSAEAEGTPGPTRETLSALCMEETNRAAGPLGIVRPLERERIEVLASAGASLHEPGANILDLEAFIRFGFEHRGSHSLSARIDRIDQLADGAMRVVDYKTGQASQKLLEPKKDDLQMGVYALAIRARDGELPNARAEYWVLSTGERGQIDFGKLDLEKTRETIREVIDGILDGRFDRGEWCGGLCAWLPPEVGLSV